MPRLKPFLVAILQSHRVVKFTMFGILLAFVIWFNYGTELDHAISGTPRTDSIPTTVAEEPRTPQELTANSDHYRPGAVDPPVAQSSAPAALSIEERMQKIDRDAVVAKIEKLARDVSQLDLDLAAWNKRTADLATNDSGRRIASDPVVFAAVTNLIQSEPVSPDDFSMLKRRSRALEDETLNVPQGPSQGSLDQAFSSTKAIFEKLRTNLDHAALSLGAFEKRCQFLTPSPLTLAGGGLLRLRRNVPPNFRRSLQVTG